MKITADDIRTSCNLVAVRSSGAGGQHVNKVSTKIQLSWDLGASELFDEVQKAQLAEGLASYINSAGIVQLSQSDSRSQYQNKTAVLERLAQLINKALQPKIKRIATKKTKSSDRKRLESKRRQAERKVNRRKFDL